MPSEAPNGRATDLEGLSQDQSGQHPRPVFPRRTRRRPSASTSCTASAGRRIQQKRWCPTCQVEVANTDLVKGYEFEKGKYVVIDEEDMAKVRPESTRVINVVQFADASMIDPVYVERPYYLAPDGNVAAEAFAVMREGMAGKAAVGKLALYGREYLVAIQPRENGLVMYTLAARQRSALDERHRRVEDRAGEMKPDEVKLAKQVIGNFETEGDLTQYKDDYQEELRRIIDAKIEGEEVVAQAEEEPPKVVNLMEALRQSLERVSATKKRTAKIGQEPAAKMVARAPAKKRARG